MLNKILLNATPNSIPINPAPIPHITISRSSLVLIPTITLYIAAIKAINKITVSIILKIVSLLIKNLTQLSHILNNIDMV